MKFQAGLASRAFEFFIQFSFLFMIFYEERGLKCDSLLETILSVHLSLLIISLKNMEPLHKNCQIGISWVYSGCVNVQHAFKSFFYGDQVPFSNSLISKRVWKMSLEIFFYKNIYCSASIWGVCINGHDNEGCFFLWISLCPLKIGPFALFFSCRQSWVVHRFM